MKVSPLLRSRLNSLKPGEELQVILILNESFDSAQVVKDIESKKARLLTPVEDTDTLKVAIGAKESLLAFEDFPWLDIMFENQDVTLIW